MCYFYNKQNIRQLTLVSINNVILKMHAKHVDVNYRYNRKWHLKNNVLITIPQFLKLQRYFDNNNHIASRFNRIWWSLLKKLKSTLLYPRKLV